MRRTVEINLVKEHQQQQQQQIVEYAFAHATSKRAVRQLSVWCISAW